MPDTVIENVSDTAFWIAHYRALESQRTDALSHDPLAGLLAGDRGKTIAAAMPRGSITAWSVVIRTCIIDDYIRSAINEGVDTVLAPDWTHALFEWEFRNIWFGSRPIILMSSS